MKHKQFHSFENGRNMGGTTVLRSEGLDLQYAPDGAYFTGAWRYTQ